MLLMKIPEDTTDKSYEIIKETLASEFKRNHFYKGLNLEEVYLGYNFFHDYTINKIKKI